MAKVKVRNEETLEQALRRFNRLVHREGIIKDAKRRKRYEKPSEVKRMKNKERARKIMIEKKYKP